LDPKVPDATHCHTYWEELPFTHHCTEGGDSSYQANEKAPQAAEVWVFF